MPIYVPSMSRADTLGWGVARFASPEMRARLIYVVPEAQADAYRAALPAAAAERPGLEAAVVLTCGERGIARTRRWIGEHARESGADRFLMLDDDVWFYTRTTGDPSDFHLEYSTPQQVNEMLGCVSDALDTYAHVGISAREGNNRIDRQHPLSRRSSGGVESITSLVCTRTLRALAYQTEAFLACEHGRVEVQEDFDVNLQLLERGLPNINLAHWAQGQRQTGAPGGCSDYRDHAVQEASARRLAELHPGVVRLVEKKNKSGGEFGHRTEVVISWKKAYERGLERLGKEHVS